MRTWARFNCMSLSFYLNVNTDIIETYLVAAPNWLFLVWWRNEPYQNDILQPSTVWLTFWVQHFNLKAGDTKVRRHRGHGLCEASRYFYCMYNLLVANLLLRISYQLGFRDCSSLQPCQVLMQICKFVRNLESRILNIHDYWPANCFCQTRVIFYVAPIASYTVLNSENISPTSVTYRKKYIYFNIRRANWKSLLMMSRIQYHIF